MVNCPIQLISQIDVDHWTVKFLDGPWKDRTGDYRLEGEDLKEQHKLTVSVQPYKRRPEPDCNGYCGKLEIVP